MHELALGNQLCFALYSASRSMTALYRPFLEQMGVTYPQYLVLLVLWEHPGISMKELGRRLRLDYGTLSPLTKRLEGAGLVETVRSPDDARSMLLTATTASETLQAQATTMIERSIAEVGISIEEIQELRADITELGRRIDAAARP